MDDIARALNALQHLDPGCDREQWIRIGMAAKSASLTLDDFSGWSASGGNYAGERDVAAVWRSFTDGKVTPATLFKMAFDAGWNDPAKARHNWHSKRQTVTVASSSIRLQKTPSIAVTPVPNAHVMEIWNRGVEAKLADEYIFGKAGKPDGLRVYPASAPPLIIGKGDDQITAASGLMVPCYAPDGETLLTIQIIPLVGKKKNLPGAQFGSGYFTVGSVTDRIFIVEGIGQAWAINKATGCAAVVCFGAGRMATVAKAIRERYSDVTLVLVPDKAKENQAAEIAHAVRGEWVEMPNDKPANYDANDYAAEYGADKLAALLDKRMAPARRYRLLAAADLLTTPPLRWLVRGILPAQGLASMFGASGSGKSFLALDLSAAIADGAEWFGLRVVASPVVYAALEGEHGFRQRVGAWQIHHGRDLPAGLHFMMQPFDLRTADDLAELADAVIAAGGAGGLLVLDTLNRAASGADENSSRDMGEIIAATKRLQSLIGGTVLLIHHTGKDSTKGLRGHSSLHAALDAAIEVTRTDDRREWSIAKSKDDSDSAAYTFRLSVVELGTDDQGDPVTSCAVVPAEDAGEAVKRVRLPRGGNQKAVYDVAAELLREGKHLGQAGAPATRPCVSLDDLIAGCRGRLAVETDRVPERVRLAVTGLVNGGVLVSREGWLWLP